MRLFRSRSDVARIWVFCDGGLGSAPYGSLPQPIRPGNGSLTICAGCGALVREDGGRVLDWAWRELPPVTNNEAEYAGLLLGAELAIRQGAELTVFVLDSEVVVGQMEGRFAVNSRSLRHWHARANRAVRALPNVRYCLVPRSCNALADALARQAGIPWAELRRVMERDLSQGPYA